MIPPTVMRYDTITLENKDHIVVYGVDDEWPELCVIGWVEDGGPHQADEAVIVNEPLYFEYTTKDIPSFAEMSFIYPKCEVPLAIELFTFGSIVTYEGKSHTARQYHVKLNAARALTVSSAYVTAAALKNKGTK